MPRPVAPKLPLAPKGPLSLKLSFAIALAVLAIACLDGAGTASVQRGRIQTGDDLYRMCQVAVDYDLNPQGKAPIQKRLCKQYISNYFLVLERLHNDPYTQKVHEHDEATHFQCAEVPGPRSYTQLARQILREAEWHPELKQGPAVDLIERAFNAIDPC